MNILNKSIGIDLGTTYSCVGYYNNGKVEIITNKDGEKIIPSFFSLSDNNEILIGNEAKENINLKTIYDIKRLIGKNYSEIDLKYLSYNIIDKNGKPYVNLFNKDYSPEDISSLILIHLKKMAEKYLGFEIENAVITVPAYFNDSQRQATREAGISAGLNVLRIINEPTSAAIAYGIDKIEDTVNQRIIIVIDLGGGTTDISLLALEDGVFEVLATSGNCNLGGSDIDNIIVNYMAENLNLDLSNKIILKDLKLIAEVIKKKLSQQNLVKITDNLNITVDNFNNLCMDIFKKFLEPINSVVHNSNLDDINEIILVGGTTRIPKIRELISDYFNNKKKLHFDINPDEAIATGAAIHAAILSGCNLYDKKLDEIVLLDIIPLSLGIETDGGLMSILIPKGSTIPIKKTQIFSTAYDNQTFVKIKIFEGERILAEQNNKLDEFIISDISPQPKGVPKIEITYYINNNGILEVSAIEKSSGKNEKCIISRNKFINDTDKINDLIEEANKLKDEDNIYKHQIEIKNKLLNLCNNILNNKHKYKSEIIIKATIINNDSHSDNFNDSSSEIIYNQLVDLIINNN